MIGKLVSKKRLATASLTNLVYFIFSSLLFLVVTPLTLKVLGKEVYGLWAILLAILQFAGLANFGTASAVIKFSAQFSVMKEGSDQFSAAVLFSYFFMLLASILATAAVWSLRGFIARQVNTTFVNTNQFSQAIGIISLSLIPIFLSQVSKGILYGLVKNELAGGFDFLQNAFLWIGALGVGIYHRDIILLASLSVGINWFLCLISTVMMIRVTHQYGLKFVWDTYLARQILSYSFLVWISSLGIAMFQSLDRILVGVIIGPEAAGVYSIGTSVALRLNMLAGQFTQVLVPFASSYQANGLTDEIRHIFRKVSQFVALLLACAGALLLIWMGSILSWWISPEFAQEYVLIFRLLILAYAIFSLHRPAHQLLTGLGKVVVPSIMVTTSGALMLSMVYLLTPSFQLIGAAAANLFYSTIVLMTLYAVSILKLHLRVFLYDYIFPFMVIIPSLYFLLYPDVNLLPQFALSLLSVILSLTVLASSNWSRLKANKYIQNIFDPVRFVLNTNRE